MSDWQGSFEMTIEPRALGELVDFLVGEGMLCRRCTELIISRTDARLPIAQNEICSQCQQIISGFLAAELERRVHGVLKERGIPPQVLSIGQKG